jgi:alpha-L-rhamnosidase
LGIQGAAAYGLYAELGDESTRRSLVDKYEALGHFDTGFIGTYVLLDVLFESGYENLAYKLLTGHGIGSFGYMIDRGATTVWEHWLGEGSHCHPMFGACAVYLFNSLLGIEQDADSYGYERIVISPKIPDGLDEAYGSILTVKGRISVRFKRDGKKIEFTVEIPEGVSALFEFRGTKEVLTKSENIIHCEVQYERYN